MDKVLKKLQINYTFKDIFQLGQNIPINNLEDILNYASDKYYNTGKPVITDDEFDILIDFLKKRAPKSIFLKKVGAPTKNKVSLDYYLGSMDKVKPPSNKLINWQKKYFPPYYLSDKLDGISGLLIYNKNKITFYTRGTATEGMDITSLVKYIKLPSYEKIKSKVTKLGIKNELALRGEIIMSKEKFKKHEKHFKNSRNLVSGLVNSKTKNPLISQDLDFVVYNILDPLYKYSDQIKLAKKLGFNTVYTQIEKEINFNVLNQILKQRKNNSPYEVDGVIITDNIKRPLQNNKNPEYAFAFKDILEDNFKDAIVTDIEWNISKNGKIIPTILIKPIELNGVTISRVSGFNARYICDNGISKNSQVVITRSGDVIPYILKVIKKQEPLLPNIPYQWNKSKIDIISIGESRERKIKQIFFFFSTLDVKGFGEKLIEKMVNNSFDTIEKILNMKKIDFLKLPNVKEKSANNFYEELLKLKSKEIKIEQLISATNSLGDNFGSRKAKLIFNKYPEIIKQKNINKWKDKLILIDGIEEKTANQVIDYWDNLQKNLLRLNKFFKISFNTTKQNIKYKNWVLTGFRDKELENYITDLGGNIQNNISKNTDILIVKDINNKTSKLKKAIELNIKIIEKNNLDIKKLIGK